LEDKAIQKRDFFSFLVGCLIPFRKNVLVKNFSRVICCYCDLKEDRAVIGHGPQQVTSNIKAHFLAHHENLIKEIENPSQGHILGIYCYNFNVTDNFCLNIFFLILS
jgi:hypothetical protein